MSAAAAMVDDDSVSSDAFDKDAVAPWRATDGWVVLVDPIAAAELRADLASPTEQLAARLALCEQWLAAGAIGSALAAARHAVRIAPDDRTALTQLALLLGRIGFVEEAAMYHLRRAERGDLRGWLAAAECYVRAGQNQQAIESSLRAETLAQEKHSAIRKTLEIVRSTGEHAWLLEHLTRARQVIGAEVDDSILVDLWVESKGLQSSVEVAQLAQDRGATPIAVAILRESFVQTLQHQRYEETHRIAERLRLVVSDDERLVIDCIHALIHPNATTRELARDSLSERGERGAVLARLRAEAARESNAVRSASAWKGVAAFAFVDGTSIEATTEALGNALARVPEDDEALAQLEALRANSPRAAIDALAHAAITSRSQTLAVRWAQWEAGHTDPCATLSAIEWARALDCSAGVPESSAALQQRAQQLTEQFESAARVVEAAGSRVTNAELDALLAVLSQSVGVLKDPARFAKLFSAGSMHRADIAEIWLRALWRNGQSDAELVVLRRIATRAVVSAVRSKAAIALAERPSQSHESLLEVAELLLLSIDEQGPSVDAATSAFLALCEHLDDPKLKVTAIQTLCNASAVGEGETLLARIAGRASGRDLCSDLFDEQQSPRVRAGAWEALSLAVGESPSLLARWTRALLASAGEGGRIATDVAKRFAETVPLSPEASIAWFGVASLVNDAEQLVAATKSVVHALATPRDISGVVRSALARIQQSNREDLLAELLRTVIAGPLVDRTLRTAVLEASVRLTDAQVTTMVFEACLACAENNTEAVGLLRRLGETAESMAATDIAVRAYRRLVAFLPGDHTAIRLLLHALERRRDAAGIVRVLPALLAMELEPTERKSALWLLAGCQRVQNALDDVALTLERIAAEFRDFSDRAAVIRALKSIGQEERVAKLAPQWASEEPNSRRAAALLTEAANCARVSRAPNKVIMTLVRQALSKEPETPEALLLAENIARESHASQEMLAIYDDLYHAAAGAHGRTALNYRKALFLENQGHLDQALEAYFAAFESRPAMGAAATAIARLSVGRRPELLVALHRRLADNAHTNDQKVGHLLDAARAARTDVGDISGSLRLLLEAQDVLRDTRTSNLVIETARVVRATDPALHREAMQLIADRGIAVADEVWEDDARRLHALRAFEAAVDCTDSERALRAAQLYLKEGEGEPAVLEPMLKVIAQRSVDTEMRAALQRIPALAQRPELANAAPTVEAAHDAVKSLRATEPYAEGSSQAAVVAPVAAPAPLDVVKELVRKGAIKEALATARDALASAEDEALKIYALGVARTAHDAEAELAIIDAEQEHTFGLALAEADLLRSVELLRGPLRRADDAWRRLAHAMNEGVFSGEIVSVAHEIAEQRNDWTAVASILERRISLSKDREEIRALRLRRAAILEQRLGNVAAARQELETVVEDEPSHRPALRYLADLYLRVERWHDAGECFARVAASTQNRSEAGELLALAGDAFLRGGESGGALVQYRRALEMHPTHVRALQGLEKLYRAKNDLDGLERVALSLANQTEVATDAVSLRLLAARAALDAGATSRARSHVDAVRAHAHSDELAPIDALLPPLASENKPISRNRFTAVVVGAAADNPSTNNPEPRPSKTSSASQRTMRAADSIDPAPAKIRSSGQMSVLGDEKSPSVAAPSATTVDDQTLQDRSAQGDETAQREIMARLARSEAGREEALRLERERYNADPSKLDVLESIEGLLARLERHEHALAVRSVREVLSGRDSNAAAPALQYTPEPPPDSVVKWLISPEAAQYAELGTLLWDALATVFRREITGYGVTGVDRVISSAPTEIAKLYAAVVRTLQLPRTALFVRGQVPGGVLVARSQPPAVVLASALTHDAPVPRYLLGFGVEGTRSGWVLVSSLDGEDRAALARAVLATFGADGKLAGEPATVTRLARELVAALTARSQKRLEDLLVELSRSPMPFSEQNWLAIADRARARAGLLTSGDFAVASQMVVIRQRGGGTADVAAEIHKLEALRDLARFAVSDAYLRIRWDSVNRRGTRG
jgi:tetratricopeptide (TPR) repeat protein